MDAHRLDHIFLDRITSYNVCYTKLLRAGLFPHDVSVDVLLQDLSRLMTGVVVASLALGAVCSLLVGRWWQAMLVRITSYNVCYTKLLRVAVAL